MCVMSRTESLAAEFERVSRELVEYVSGLDRDQWLTPGVNSPIMTLGDEDENRPVGTIAHHVAMGYGRSAQGIATLVAGGQLTAPQAGATARHAAEHPEPDQAETIALLRKSGAAVAAAIRGLTEEQLDIETNTFVGQTTVAGLIERAVIFHPVWHLTSIRATLEPAEQPA